MKILKISVLYQKIGLAADLFAGASIFDGDRDDLFLPFSFVTSFMIFSCQSKISDATDSLFSQELRQDSINLRVSSSLLLIEDWLDGLGFSIALSWTIIPWMLFNSFLRSLISLFICLFSLEFSTCLAYVGFLASATLISCKKTRMMRMKNNELSDLVT